MKANSHRKKNEKSPPLPNARPRRNATSSPKITFTSGMRNSSPSHAEYPAILTRMNRFTIGTIASVLQLLKLPDGTIKVLVEGTDRAEIAAFGERSGVMVAHARVLEAAYTRSERETDVIGRQLAMQMGGWQFTWMVTGSMCVLGWLLALGVGRCWSRLKA